MWLRTDIVTKLLAASKPGKPCYLDLHGISEHVDEGCSVNSCIAAKTFRKQGCGPAPFPQDIRPSGLSHCKDFYESTSLMECHTAFEPCSDDVLIGEGRAINRGRVDGVFFFYVQFEGMVHGGLDL